jgi:hypothetical protein
MAKKVLKEIIYRLIMEQHGIFFSSYLSVIASIDKPLVPSGVRGQLFGLKFSRLKKLM